MTAFQEFLKVAASTLITDASRALLLSARPAELVINEIEGVLNTAQRSSQSRVQNTRDQAEIYRRFHAFKAHFRTAPDRDGKYVYYFLYNIEDLPAPLRHDMVYQAVVFIDTEPDYARVRIAEIMRTWIQSSSLLEVGTRKSLALRA